MNEGVSYTESKIGKLDTCYHILIDTTNDKAMYSLFLYTIDIEHFYHNEGWDKGFGEGYSAGKERAIKTITETIDRI